MSISIAAFILFSTLLADPDVVDPIAYAQKRVIKIYGAGGVGRIEGYGSGIMIDGAGLILTVDSPLLSADVIRIVLADGSRRTARIVGIDRLLDLAALQIDGDRPTDPFEHFDLSSPTSLQVGDPAWGISNLFGIAVGDELVSVQQGIVVARTEINSRQGMDNSTIPGSVYILDLITNNPGAAGGALIDSQGKLAGILAKEIKNRSTQTWISVAIPIETTRSFLDKVKEGKADTNRPRTERTTLDRRALARVDLRGIRLLPEVLDQTPPFIDEVQSGSPAEQSGLLADDLIVYLGEVIIPSTNEFRAVMLSHPPQEPIKVIVMRDGELVSLLLAPRDPAVEESPSP
jgi:serine protease Do